MLADDLSAARARNKARLEASKRRVANNPRGCPIGLRGDYVEQEPVAGTGETQSRLPDPAKVIELNAEAYGKLRASKDKPYPHVRYTEADYAALHAAQDGKCAICGKRETRFAVDHDHYTGAIRGLLCRNCNLGLGSFQDRPDALRRAISYLKRSWQTQKSSSQSQ